MCYLIETRTATTAATQGTVNFDYFLPKIVQNFHSERPSSAAALSRAAVIF